MLTCIVYVPDKLSLLSFMYQISHPFFLSAASYHLLSSTPGYCLWFVCAPNYHLLVCVQSCHLLCFCTMLFLDLFLYQPVICIVSTPGYYLLRFCVKVSRALFLYQAVTCIVSAPGYYLLRFYTKLSHALFLYQAVTCVISVPVCHLLVCVQSCHLLCFCTKLSLVLFLYQAVTCFFSVPSYHLLCFCTMLFVALCLHRAIVCCVFTPTYHLLCFYTKLSLASFLHPTTHHSLDRSRFCSSRPRSPGEWIPFGFCTGLCLASSMIDACLCRSVDVGAHRHSPCCCGQMLLFLSSFILFYSSLLTRVTDLFKQT